MRNILLVPPMLMFWKCEKKHKTGTEIVSMKFLRSLLYVALADRSCK